MGRGQLRHLARAYATVGDRRQAGRPRTGSRSAAARRVPRTPSYVRAVPHADRPDRHLSRKRLFPGRWHARRRLAARQLRFAQPDLGRGDRPGNAFRGRDRPDHSQRPPPRSRARSLGDAVVRAACPDRRGCPAMGSYLKTLPPVRHFVPEPLQFGFVETLIGKILSPLPAAIPRFLSYADGDFADPEVPRFSRDLPQRALETAQWVVLAIGLVAFALVGPRPRSWVKAVLLLSGAALLVVLAWLLVRLPHALPPEPLGQGLMSAAPKLDTR